MFHKSVCSRENYDGYIGNLKKKYLSLLLPISSLPETGSRRTTFDLEVGSILPTSDKEVHTL